MLPYGDAQAFGGLSLDPTATQISAIIGNNQGTGYWLLDPQAWQYSFSTATPEPMAPGGATIAAAVASQIEPDPDVQGLYCNPYGPCEQWCALFATWAWEAAGIDIPRYAFTGDIWGWAAARGLALPPTATPAVGDAVLYGTGPSSTATSVHVGHRDPGLARRLHHDGGRRLGPGPGRLSLRSRWTGPSCRPTPTGTTACRSTASPSRSGHPAVPPRIVPGVFA